MNQVSLPVDAAFRARCLHIRKEVLQMVRYGKRGHIPSAFSLVEILVTLYDHIMQFRPDEPEWVDRDRFILSKGHGCLALYAVLADKGFFPREWYQGFCTFDGELGGHPEERNPGVEATTGSLGHGLAIAVGFALAARLQQRTFRNYVVLGDGECGEGSVWEAALAAAKHKLENLVVLVDYNKFMSYGPTREVCDLEPFADKWRAFGFAAEEVDMVAEPERLRAVLEQVPAETGKPTAIICHTIKGRGLPYMENNLSWHHKSKISEADIEKMIRDLEAAHA